MIILVKTSRLIRIAALCALLLAGCRKNAGTASDDWRKVRVGYIGLTCEAPIFTAVENGFFKEEGLDVTPVKCEWANYKDVLALGGFDITHHLVMYFLKPIEQGLDVKFTGGIHRGCLRVQALMKGNIHTVKDLRGKRIGVPGMGTPPFIFANRVLGANGIDPSKEITWLVFPAGELGPGAGQRRGGCGGGLGTDRQLLLAQGKVRNIADQAVDTPYNDEYCCAVLVNGKFLGEESEGGGGSDPRLAQRRKVGGSQSARRRQALGGKEISGFEPGAKHGRDFASALRAERFRRGGGGANRRPPK